MKTASATKDKRLVVDASVGVKWFSEEQDTPRAEALLAKLERADMELYAPDLFLYEVGNALGRGKRLDEARVLDALEMLFACGMEFFPAEMGFTLTAARFMVQYELTFYDALYGALAFTLGIPLLTANPKDHRKIKEIEVMDLAAV